MRHLLLLLALLLRLSASAQAILNLDFEPEANRRQPLLFWSRRQQPDELLIRLDTVSPAQHGRGSLLIDASRAEEPEGTYLSTSLPVPDSLGGQIVTFTAWIRTEEYTGRAWLRASSYVPTADRLPGAASSNDNIATTPALRGSSGWQQLRVQVPVSRNATSVDLTLQMEGRGRLWADNFQLAWPHQRYVDAPLPGTEPLVLPPGTLLPDWDFERRGPAGVPGQTTSAGWVLDSAVVQHGRRSLHVPPGPAPVYLGYVPLDTLGGHNLTVRGYVRYASPTAPRPRLFLRRIGRSDRLTFPYDRFSWHGSLAPHDALPPAAAAGGWQRFELTTGIASSQNLRELVLLLQPGASDIWFDHLELLVDGRSYVPPQPPVPGQPLPAELAWLRKAAHPLRATAPDAADAQDLAAFGQLIGKASVIGLGEATLGSHEQMQLKHRLFRYLVEQKGVRLLALEADLGPCLALNDYLQTGQGDPKVLVADLPAWDTAELLALVQWMRAYNQRSTGPKLQLLGIDVNDAPESLRYLRQRLPATPGYRADKLAELQRQLRALADAKLRLNLLQRPEQTDPQLTAVLGLLTELRTAYDLPFKLSSRYLSFPNEATVLPQLLRGAEQFSLYQTMDSRFRLSYRAACLAENLRWVRAQAAGSKVVVWGCNETLATYNRDDETLGLQLRRQYGSDFVSIGLAFGEGSYRALAATEAPTFVTAPAPAAPVGSYEHYFRAAGLPTALLDLRPVDLAPGTQWLFENLRWRDGALKAYTQPFTTHSLRREFDAVLYLPKSTPAQGVR